MCLFVTLCMSVCVEPFLGWFLEEGPRAIILDQFVSIRSTKGCIEHHWVLQVELDVYPPDLGIKRCCSCWIRRFGILTVKHLWIDVPQVIRILEML